LRAWSASSDESSAAGKPVASSTGTNNRVADWENIMSQTTHPSKHLVRAYLERRTRDVKPPPKPEEIRRQLGWGMLMFEPKVSNGGRS
jgi:hypothetical protein